METLGLEQMCRLCGKQLHNTIAIDIFNSQENYEKKIRTLLPIMVYEMDCMPKYLCYNCSVKLEEFYNFYIQTMNQDIQMKNRLSWMQNKPEEQPDIIPTVYFADLNALKIKYECEEYEDFCNSQGNTNPIDTSNVEHSIKNSPDGMHEDNLNCRSPSTTNDIHNYNNNDNEFPLNVVIPLERINDQLSTNDEVLDSKIDLTDVAKQTPRNEIICGNISHNTINNNDKINDFNGTNSNCRPMVMPEVLIKNEMKENNEFIRKLRPRRTMSCKSSTKMIKEKKMNKTTEILTVDKPSNLISDLKLSKKVEIKVEKLDCKTIKRNVDAIIIDKKYNETKNTSNNYLEDIHNNLKKPKLEISNDILEQIKPLRTRNNMKNIGPRYESKVEIHMKGITVKLTKINVAKLKQQEDKRDKITKMKKAKKIHDTYSCERCKELFTKRELYRLHFCYFH